MFHTTSGSQFGRFDIGTSWRTIMQEPQLPHVTEHCSGNSFFPVAHSRFHSHVRTVTAQKHPLEKLNQLILDLSPTGCSDIRKAESRKAELLKAINELIPEFNGITDEVRLEYQKICMVSQSNAGWFLQHITDRLDLLKQSIQNVLQDRIHAREDKNEIYRAIAKAGGSTLIRDKDRLAYGKCIVADDLSRLARALRKPLKRVVTSVITQEPRALATPQRQCAAVPQIHGAVLELQPNPSESAACSPIGIRNEGANCWINSTMQLLMNTELRELLRTRPDDSVKKFMQQYCEDKKSSLSVTQASTQPIRELFANPSGISANIHVQEDAHEGFMMLLPDAWKNTRSCDSNPKTLHPFAFETTITRKYKSTDKYKSMLAKEGVTSGLNADMETVSTEPRFYVELDLKPAYIQFREALEHSLVDENDQGDGRYLDCVLPLKSTKTEFTNGFPEHLLIQIKRLNYSAVSRITEKNNQKLHIPAEVVLKQPNDYAKYDLKAFIEHQGVTSNCGHYVTYVNEGSYDVPYWILYNDNFATHVTTNEALRHVENAYIPYFKKRIGEVNEKEFQRVNDVNDAAFALWRKCEMQNRHAQPILHRLIDVFFGSTSVRP